MTDAATAGSAVAEKKKKTAMVMAVRTLRVFIVCTFV